MLVSEARKPLVVSDKLIQDSPVFPSITITKRASPVKMYKLPAPSKIFAIKFNYLQTLYHTKVLKVDRDYGDPFYKVALSSSISKNASICWLQQEQQGWSMLLGPELDERLKQAITSAIECHEELNNLNEFIMEQELYHYKFINTLTGNIIAYRSVPTDLGKQEQTKILEKKREEVAISNKLELEQIYWQNQDHPIR